ARHQTDGGLPAAPLECARGGKAADGADAIVPLAAEVHVTRAMTTAAPLPAAAPPPRPKRRAEAWLIGLVLGLAVLAVIIALLASNRDTGTKTTTVPATQAPATTTPPTTRHTNPASTAPTEPATTAPTEPPPTPATS